MSAVISVHISTKAAAAQWGEKSALSYTENSITIHLNNEFAPFRQVQQAARKIDGLGVKSVNLVGDGWDSELAIAFDQGFYTAKGGKQLSFDALTAADKQVVADFQTASHWTRETINATPEELGPVQLAQRAADLLTELAPDAVSYQVITGEDLRAQGFTGIYNVGRGSERVPAMLQLDYNPTGNPDAPVSACLVGKGITFDSGGYSLKPSEMMTAMKSDMGGAATVTGALALAILRGLDKRVKLYLGCAENLISGSAYKLGDILTFKNGLKVEILNTDAEGRLALADCLLAAEEHQAPLLLDAATLTGAAKMAVGRDYNTVFGFDSETTHQVLTGARQENELAWPLPLEKWHQSRCPSNFADMANVHAGPDNAGATTAAAFLSRFVREDGQGWVHMDLAGCYQPSANDMWAAGGKGHGIRTIARTLLDAE